MDGEENEGPHYLCFSVGFHFFFQGTFNQHGVEAILSLLQ